MAPLGRGGMGEVYSAVDTDLNRNVALKFITPGAMGSIGSINRFIREARSASALNHPNIVTVHEVIREGAALSIVMELVDGIALRKLCAEAQPIDKVAMWGRIKVRPHLNPTVRSNRDSRSFAR